MNRTAIIVQTYRDGESRGGLHVSDDIGPRGILMIVSKDIGFLVQLSKLAKKREHFCEIKI